MCHVFIAVIEYDASITPVRIAGTTREIVEAAAVQHILRQEAGWDTDDFLSDNPKPDYDNPGEVSSWLSALREAYTVPWVSVVQVPVQRTVPKG